MSRELKLSIGQHSDKGRKQTNQDFYGALIPEEPLLGLKGIAIVLADGISTSSVSPVASESAVKGFLTDYYCTSEVMVRQNLGATRDRRDQFLAACADPPQPVSLRQGQGLCLHAERDGHQVDHGAHLPCRRFPRSIASIGHSLEQLTNDHRVVISSEQTYLGRALGMNPQIEIDYQALRVEKGDVFVLATDGVHEHVERPLHRRRHQGPRRRPRRVPPGRSSKKPINRGQPRQPDRSDRADRRAAGPARPARSSARRPNCRCRRCWKRGWCSTATESSASCTAAAAATSIWPSDTRRRRAGGHQDPVDRPARRSGLSEALHDGGVGRPAHQQRPCPEALCCSRASATTFTSSPNSSTARP